MPLLAVISRLLMTLPPPLPRWHYQRHYWFCQTPPPGLHQLRRHCFILPHYAALSSSILHDIYDTLIFFSSVCYIFIGEMVLGCRHIDICDSLPQLFESHLFHFHAMTMPPPPDTAFVFRRAAAFLFRAFISLTCPCFSLFQRYCHILLDAG